jgi:hypothetical protein
MQTTSGCLCVGALCSTPDDGARKKCVNSNYGDATKAAIMNENLDLHQATQ